jgi:hypothetical protein
MTATNRYRQYAFRIGANVWRSGAEEWGMGEIVGYDDAGLLENYYLVRYEGRGVRVEAESSLTPD